MTIANPETHSKTSLASNPTLKHLPRYIRGRSIEEVKRELGLTEIIKLGSNENLLGPSPHAVEAMRRAAADMHYYPSVEVHDLRVLLAEHLGGGLTADHIIVGSGSADVLHSLARAYIFDGGESIVQLPAFQMYEILTAMYGGQARVLPRSANYRYDLDAMLAQVTPDTRLIFINNPNNPTGSYVTKHELEYFLDRVPPTTLVVLDEAYADFAEAPDFADSLRHVRAGRNVVVTRTFSKLYGLAGARVGFGVARKDIINTLLQTQLAFQVGMVSLVAAIAALKDQEHVRHALDVNRTGKQYLYREFEALGLRCMPSEGNFIMLVDLPFPVSDIERLMSKQGVIIRPCEPFGLPDAIRITIAPPRENERMIAALRHTLAELEK